MGAERAPMRQVLPIAVSPWLFDARRIHGRRFPPDRAPVEGSMIQRSGFGRAAERQVFWVRQMARMPRRSGQSFCTRRSSPGEEFISSSTRFGVPPRC